MDPSVCNSIYLNKTTESEILEILQGFANKKSGGPDGVPPSLLRSAAVYLAKPLCYIVNKSLETGVFPQVLKTARVTPVFKSGDTQNVKNFRPISIVSVFSKVFEAVVLRRLMVFNEKYKILSYKQNRLRTGRSTEAAIFD